jgi:hypothetical protein
MERAPPLAHDGPERALDLLGGANHVGLDLNSQLLRRRSEVVQLDQLGLNGGVVDNREA